MSLRDDILNYLSNNIFGAHCDNCYNKEHCPDIQYKTTRESGGACFDWMISDDLAEDITDEIMDLVRNALGVK